VETPSFLRRHPWARWLAPAAVVGLAAITAAGVFASGKPAAQQLPATTPDALIASVRSADIAGYTGTVVSRISLGLPELPNIGTGGGGDGSSLASLLTGSHTMQVWYGGAGRQRLAVLGATDETDLFRDGRSVWQWDSARRVALHAQLPARSTRQSNRITGLVGPHPDGPAAFTPGGIAARALATMAPDTTVHVRRGPVIADRSTYSLVIVPRDTQTLVGSVHIDVDGQTKVPLAVEVYPRDAQDSAAIDVRFTSIDFTRPSRTSFQFAPPSGSTVRQVDLASIGQRLSGTGADTLSRLRVTGANWSTVACYELRRPPTLRGALARVLRPVSGSWGHGRLLQADLASVLVTRDGWVCAGAVDPATLFAAAAGR
jgi:outer membrane lipoprotein-sorting protein